MRHFQQIAAGVDVGPLLLDLRCNPQLWNAHTARTVGDDSPHREVDDIWLRFRNWSELTSRAAFAEPFVPQFYPGWYRLPNLRPLVFAVMTRLAAVQLGVVLITRIPPGGQAAPHDDCGRWAAEFFNVKVALPLATNASCYNTCEKEIVTMQAGDAWIFENQVIHSTVNNGETERITLLISARCE